MFNIIVFVSNKEILLYPPPMEEYWKLGDPNHEKLPVLEIEPSSYNPMWVLVNHLASSPNTDLVSIRNCHSNSDNGVDGKHVTVWVLPKALGVIDNVWGDEQFIRLMKEYGSLGFILRPSSNGWGRETPNTSNGSNFLTSGQISERVIHIANRALHNGNGK